MKRIAGIKEALKLPQDKVHPQLIQMDNAEYLNGTITRVRQMQCVLAFPFSERMDCSVYELENGVLAF